MEMLVLVVPIIAGFFWISQLADVILIDRRRFESHTHRLVWFLVIVIGNIIGAVWYFVWKRQHVATPEPLRPQIAGGVCPECDQRIVTVTDGLACATCGVVVHRNCSNNDVCAACGGDLAAAHGYEKD